MAAGGEVDVYVGVWGGGTGCVHEVGFQGRRLEEMISVAVSSVCIYI